MDVDEMPLPAAGFRRPGEVEKSGAAEESVFRGGCSSYPADVMRPPRRCSSDFTSKKLAKLGMNEDVFPSLICEEKVDTPYLGHEVKPTLFSPNYEGSGGKSMKKSGTLPCAKRLRTEQPDDSMNIDGFDDLKSIATQIGSETNQFPCPEKSEMVKKKRRRDVSRTDKKSNRASTKSKYDSFVSKTGFSCSDSVSGGNTIPGTYGLKSDLRVVDDLSLNELLDGSYKYANLRPAKGKKTSNMNDNLLLSVRKALSVLSPPGAVDSYTKASLCLAQPNSYSSIISESDEMDKHIEDSVPSSKVEHLCQANSGESILYQPKVVLEKLALPSVNDLDALLNLSISSPPLQSTKNVTTLGHASLPPFSWSVNHNGSWKPSIDSSKQASSRNISHGKWLRIGSNSAYSGDYQSSSSELQLKRSDHNEVSMNQQKIDDLLQDVKNLTAPAHRLFDEASDLRAMTGPSSVHIPDNTRMLNLLEDVGSSDCHRESVSKDYNFLGNSASDATPRSGGSVPRVVQLSLNIGVKDSKMAQEQHTVGTHGCSDSCSYSCRTAPGGCDQNSLHLPSPETWKSGHSPRATCAADILCEIKRKSRSKTSRSNTSGKTKWPKAPSQKTMKARKSPSSTEKTEKPYMSADHHNRSPPSIKHKSMSEKNGVTHKNTTVREPIRLPAPVEHGESSARMERDLVVQPRSLHMNPVRKTAEACGSEQNLRKAAPKGSSLGFGGTYIKDWSSRGRTKRI